MRKTPIRSYKYKKQGSPSGLPNNTQTGSSSQAGCSCDDRAVLQNKQLQPSGSGSSKFLEGNGEDTYLNHHANNVLFGLEVSTKWASKAQNAFKGGVHILGKICPRSDPDIAHIEYSMDPLMFICHQHESKKICA